MACTAQAHGLNLHDISLSEQFDFVQYQEQRLPLNGADSTVTMRRDEGLYNEQFVWFVGGLDPAE